MTALSVSEELPPPDTLVGTVRFASGTPAGVSITFAGSVLRFSLSVTGTKGSLEVRLFAQLLQSCCSHYNPSVWRPALKRQLMQPEALNQI